MNPLSTNGTQLLLIVIISTIISSVCLLGLYNVTNDCMLEIAKLLK